MYCSVVSYPERGPYGDNKFRGNTSSFLIKGIVLWLKPKRVLDPMAGAIPLKMYVTS
jgi:hypothetical protein